jgi:hypothetical protein
MLNKMKKKVIKKKVSRVKSTYRRKHREEKGTSKLLYVVIGAVVLAVVGGYLFLNNSGSNPITSVVKKPLNPNCELKDSELCKFMNNWSGLTNYSVHSVMRGAEGEMVSHFAIAGEDRMQMMSSQNGKESYNMISIGKTTYTKDYSDNKWWKVTYEDPKNELTAVNDFKESFDFDAEEMKDKTTYKSLGKETCGSLQCFKYQVVNPDFPGTEYLWFDDREYLLRKTLHEDEGTSTESTFDYANVNIKEPSPVKEGTPEEAMGLPAMSAEDKAAMEKMQQEAAEVMKNYGNTDPGMEMPLEDTSTEGY